MDWESSMSSRYSCSTWMSLLRDDRWSINDRDHRLDMKSNILTSLWCRSMEVHTLEIVRALAEPCFNNKYTFICTHAKPPFICLDVKSGTTRQGPIDQPLASIKLIDHWHAPTAITTLCCAEVFKLKSAGKPIVFHTRGNVTHCNWAADRHATHILNLF